MNITCIRSCSIPVFQILCSIKLTFFQKVSYREQWASVNTPKHTGIAK